MSDDLLILRWGAEWTRGRVKHTWDRKKYGGEDYAKGFKIGNLSVQTVYN